MVVFKIIALDLLVIRHCRVDCTCYRHWFIHMKEKQLSLHGIKQICVALLTKFFLVDVWLYVQVSSFMSLTFSES